MRFSEVKFYVEVNGRRETRAGDLVECSTCHCNSFAIWLEQGQHTIWVQCNRCHELAELAPGLTRDSAGR